MTSWVVLSDGTLWPSYGLAMHIESARNLRRKRMPKMPGQKEPQPDVGGGANETAIAAAKLRNVIERYENLNGDKRNVAADQRELMKEAKSQGFDTKAIRALVKAREDPAKAKAESEINRLYAEALGMVDIFG